MVVWAIRWSVSSWASVEASCMSCWNVISLGLASRPNPSATARPSFTRQRRESSRWGQRNASNLLENYPEGLLRPATKPPLGILPFLLKRMPKPTEKQQIHCLKFAREHVHWSEEDWQKVVWLDKSPFEVFHPPDRHSPLLPCVGGQKLGWSFAAKGETLFLPCHCPGRKLPSDSSSNSCRTEVRCYLPRSGLPDS